MLKQEYLRPHDVCVLLQLAVWPWRTFRDLSAAVGLSLGETHNSAKRLELARLAAPGVSQVNVEGVLEFLSFGIPYVFPAQLGVPARGIPRERVEKSLSEVLGGPVKIVVTPYGALSLDVDDQEDYRILDACYEEWAAITAAVDPYSKTSDNVGQNAISTTDIIKNTKNGRVDK